MKLTEMAFDWINSKDLPKGGGLLKLIAKTESTTHHPDDPNYPVRIFTEEELGKAARTLIGRPVGLNHVRRPIQGAAVVDAEYNDGNVEAIIYVPKEWKSKVEAGEITACSVEYSWRDEIKTEAGVEFSGLFFTRVDLLEGLEPGDPDSKVMLFESASKTGRFLAEATIDDEEVPAPVVEKPFEGYADMAACVLDNQGRDDPEGYCTVLMTQIEGAAKVPELESEVEKAATEYKTLEEAFLRVKEENTTVKNDADELQSEARKELADKVGAILPNLVRPDARTRRLIQEIKGVLDESS